jgi:CheY-like chemotaxis protein
MTANATILMLEYDVDDRFITTELFDQHHYSLRVEFVNYSTELFAYLNRCSEKGLLLPVLIVINFHATPENGAAIVQKLKTDERYAHIPVVILTGIKQDAIVKECYALGANSVIQKPSSGKDTDGKIGNFLRYWFETAELV